MPFERSTLSDLTERIEGDLSSSLGLLPGVRRTNIGALARVLAVAAFNLQGFMDFISRQLFPDTAETEFLERHADIWAVARKPAASATGLVTFTGANASIIPAASVLARADGTEFSLDADATIVAGTVDGLVTAIEPGVAGNTTAGETLNLVSPVVGVTSTATVEAGGIGGGTDTESDDALRARLLSRIQQPPHGGAAADYERWALEVAGVTRAFVFPLEGGVSNVVVRIVDDNGVVSIIPNGAKIAEVQAHIDALRPVTADVTVAGPIEVALNFTIQLVPDTTAVRATVQASLEDLLRREGEPGATILLSQIREAISVSAGETDNIVTVPAGDVGHLSNQIAVMGVITWV